MEKFSLKTFLFSEIKSHDICSPYFCVSPPAQVDAFNYTLQPQPGDKFLFSFFLFFFFTNLQCSLTLATPGDRNDCNGDDFTRTIRSRKFLRVESWPRVINWASCPLLVNKKRLKRCMELWRAARSASVPDPQWNILIVPRAVRRLHLQGFTVPCLFNYRPNFTTLSLSLYRLELSYESKNTAGNLLGCFWVISSFSRWQSLPFILISEPLRGITYHGVHIFHANFWTSTPGFEIASFFRLGFFRILIFPNAISSPPLISVNAVQFLRTVKNLSFLFFTRTVI